MKLHEYQAKELFGRAGLPVPEGQVATTPEAALESGRALGFPLAVKAQVHAGGRGKAGGIKVVGSIDDAQAAIDAILGMTLQTAQTGAAGTVVKTILLENISQ